jgi:hypothetical protein
MSVKSRVETLEKRAGAASGNPKVFIVSARPDADRPDLYNLECGGLALPRVETRGVRKGDISAAAERLAESLGGYKELSDVIIIQKVIEGYKIPRG